ncbi:MAG: hypothetical protein IKM91_02990 [Candidatus Methanomethylophilaceae archaeon]|jgi:predicted transcriptional regulator|nr:hypothetical protein [Candidatus Methanomethylophilaceae archaeon]MBR6870571.1 hypothetical protein [Candidatus Methanomethylophilaceae archaeon]
MTGGKISRQVEKEVDQLYLMLKMVRVIQKNQPIGIIKLSEIFELPNHKVRYILRLLENDGVISPSANGCMLNIGYDEYVQQQLSALHDIKDKINDIEKDISGNSSS